MNCTLLIERFIKNKVFIEFCKNFCIFVSNYKVNKPKKIQQSGILSFAFFLMIVCSILSACSHVDHEYIDILNKRSYSFHYRNLDSTLYYATKAYELSGSYDDGKAEALNNLAFVNIVKMEYDAAFNKLNSLVGITDNQVELLIADIQMMRLCQRQSRNKEFYDYHESALRREHRIEEEEYSLSEHQKARLVYARSEFYIVTSTYYFYVGLEEPSVKALQAINPVGEIKTDTAQYINYLYNLGTGGIVKGNNQEYINQQEFDFLMRCYLISHQLGYKPWEANSLQALSEKLLRDRYRNKLLRDNQPAIKYLNPYEMPDSLLAGNMAQRALELFEDYGDVYQIASTYRTLASCYWQIKDYKSAIICLENALSKNNSIQKTPDLIASIREQLSVVYAAINDKQGSDYNRNIYLDLQEQTRQDRYLESRAGQLEKTSRQLNIMIWAVAILIVLIILLLWLFHWMRRRRSSERNLDELLHPLNLWRKKNEKELAKMNETYENIQETYGISKAHLIKNKKMNLEKRAKVSLVNVVTPFIDRMLREIRLLENRQEPMSLREERYAYISELTNIINDYNDVLTQWIQLRQGELSLYIESFRLQDIFDIVEKGKTGFVLKGISLDVQPTQNIVKADRSLTLFMINTLADNARKFTDKGGKVTISSEEYPEYIEILVSDNGCGIEQKVLDHIFDHKVIVDQPDSTSHGFGLVNCRGIINKYHKISKIFSVCEISAKSKLGKGSTFSFRLPKGILRAIILTLISIIPLRIMAVNNADFLIENGNQAENNTLKTLELANMYADLAYYSNINANYRKTLAYADTCRYFLNKYYLQLHPNGSHLMKRLANDSEKPAELQWFYDNLPTNYSIILDIRNESAVAALALHEWALYRYNNNVYTRLFKENSADKKLGDYCRMMQRSEANKNVAIIIMIVLLLSIFPFYYLIYYRHQLFYLFCVDKVKEINGILLSHVSATKKLSAIDEKLSDKFPTQLNSIISKIQEELRTSINQTNKSKYSIEIAEDELHRIQYENEQLHVSNNILDNCLSALKHETMYYPSRIKQLVEGKDAHLQNIGELAIYYKELYSLLSLQAMRQISTQKFINRKVSVREFLPAKIEANGLSVETTCVLGDADLLRYLFEILRQQSINNTLNVCIEEEQQDYIVFHVTIRTKNASVEDASNLFSPMTKNIPYLICRQIVREIGESTNRRRCGIIAHSADDEIILDILLSKAKYKN